MAVKGRNKPREPKPGNKSAKYNKTPGMPKAADTKNITKIGK